MLSQRLHHSFLPNRRHPLAVALACCAVALQLGCRGDAHRDAYQSVMARDYRLLEDQLNEADYTNRVLRDKLKRAEQRAQACEQPPNLSNEQIYKVDPLPGIDQLPTEYSGDVLDSGFGETVIENEAFAPAESTTPEVPDGLEPSQPTELPAPTPVPDLKMDEDAQELPVPVVPEPPGRNDTIVPPVIPGEVLPPPAKGEEIDAPPGKIDLPDALGTLTQATTRTPQGLQLHPGLSGGHRFDDGQTEGLYLVVNVVDDQGRMIDLTGFDIEAAMSVVALDPMLDASQARIGRWEFTPGELNQYIRSSPVSGLHIPVRWQNTRPSGEEVIVHVRLQTDDEEMRCNGRLKVVPATSIADWTPRGESATR